MQNRGGVQTVAEAYPRGFVRELAGGRPRGTVPGATFQYLLLHLPQASGRSSVFERNSAPHRSQRQSHRSTLTSFAAMPAA
jgi:hypothetical protein